MKMVSKQEKTFHQVLDYRSSIADTRCSEYFVGAAETIVG